MLVNDTVKRHYFDWAASAPPDACCQNVPYGNPSSKHSEGREAKLALEDARERCAAVLNVPPQTLYFTSGGTESNSIALFSNLLKKGQGRVIASNAEHSSIREGLETLEKMGKPTGRIGVDSTGRVNEHLFAKALEKYGDVRFASVMAVNNETGSITDIASIRDVIRGGKISVTRENSFPVHLHCDLVQAVGKIEIDIQNWEIDSASISAHKISGPRGIGLLYLRRPSSRGGIEVFYTGGGQEGGIRGGTENTLGAVSLAYCLEKYARLETVRAEYKKAKERWKKLITSLTAMERCVIIPQVRGAIAQNEETDMEWFSPYILQAAFKGVPGEVMARALDDLGFAVSTGSACSSSSPERPVLTAMGVEEGLRLEGIRISQGFSTTDEEIDLLLDAIAEVLKFL
jgi:cysteine desulfurase